MLAFTRAIAHQCRRSAKANQIAINKLFEAIRKQAKETKYASSL